MQYCSRCQAPLEENARFCMQCGEPVDSIAAWHAQTPDPVPEMAAQPTPVHPDATVVPDLETMAAQIPQPEIPAAAPVSESQAVPVSEPETQSPAPEGNPQQPLWAPQPEAQTWDPQPQQPWQPQAPAWNQQPQAPAWNQQPVWPARDQSAQAGQIPYAPPVQPGWASPQDALQPYPGSYPVNPPTAPAAPVGAQPSVSASSVLTWGILAIAFAFEIPLLGLIFGIVGRGKWKTHIAEGGINAGKVKVGGILAKVGIIAGAVITAILVLYIVIIALVALSAVLS